MTRVVSTAIKAEAECEDRITKHARTRSIKATTLDTRIRTTVTPALPLTK